MMKNRLALFCGIGLVLGACSDYLDLKPDKQIFVPSRAEDLWALLDNVGLMNRSSPIGLGEMASDNFFMTNNLWTAIKEPEIKSIFIWEKFPVAATHWRSNYQRISYCNVVLEQLDKLKFDQVEDAVLRGTAQFVRGLAHFEVVQVFAKAYSRESAANTLGIPIRLTSDINISAYRSDLADSYRVIIRDIEAAVKLLPADKPKFATRPNKTAALSVLARIHLSMGEYEKAGGYAEEALALDSELMDYNMMVLDKAYPFDRYNQEVLYLSSMKGEGLTESWIRVDTNLYKSYLEADLRKQAFFTKLSDGYYTFTGNFTQETAASKFCGLSTSELVLIVAECAARRKDKSTAIFNINKLIKNRYRNGGSQLTEDISDEILFSRILDERRKELVFRGLRWSDLRRLEGDYTIKRELQGKNHQINAEQIRNFAFQIPEEVMERSDLEQN